MLAAQFTDLRFYYSDISPRIYILASLEVLSGLLLFESNNKASFMELWKVYRVDSGSNHNHFHVVFIR